MFSPLYFYSLSPVQALALAVCVCEEIQVGSLARALPSRCGSTSYRWMDNEKTAMANQVFDEQSTHRCIRLFCTWPSTQGRYKFLSITFHHRKYIFPRRNCYLSGFAGTMPASPYHVSQVISHSPGHLRGARLGGQGHCGTGSHK